jgi:hypothetical protein
VQICKLFELTLIQDAVLYQNDLLDGTTESLPIGQEKSMVFLFR